MGRTFFKVFIVFFLFTILAFIHKNPAFADFTISHTEDPGEPTSLVPTPTPTPGGQAGQAIIDENTRTVTITFDGLAANTNYRAVLGWNLPDWKDNPVDAGNSGSSGTITLSFCPDGKETLKLAPDINNGHANGQCGDEDYFWAQHTYRAALYRQDDKNISNLIDDAHIYVTHYYPEILIDNLPLPLNIGSIHPSPGKPITVSIWGTRRPHHDGTRNNYDVELHNQNGKLDFHCRTVEENPSLPMPWFNVDNSHNQNTKQLSFSNREVGDYLIKINEQVNEKFTDCSAGFTYYYIGVHVRDNEKGWIDQIKADPHESDLQNIQGAFPTPPLPCLTLSPTNGGCKTAATAIGDINTQPAGFIKSVFGIILSLAGGIALLLIIISGYKLMASQGNPEAVQGAREQLTSAVVGLLFIIFSLVILQIIGVDILRIPGFGG